MRPAWIRVFLAVVTTPLAASAAPEKPNIVLLFADDLGRYASAYADPAKPSPNDIVRTPVFDRIAAAGARFDQAFVSVPSCTPSRGALYTVRALRTPDFLYVRNFKPDRWPMGAPMAAAGDAVPDAKTLEDTRAAFADIDASPTKTWLIENRKQDGLETVLLHGWEKRPEEELYLLGEDPHQVRNVVADPARAATLGKLRDQLMAELKVKQDPRLTDDFDRPPYLDKSRK